MKTTRGSKGRPKPRDPNRRLKGPYSFCLQGFLGGQLQFDHPEFGIQNQSPEPIKIDAEQTSTYSLQPDGTGTIKLKVLRGDVPDHWNLSIAIAEKGKKIFLNVTMNSFDVGLGEPDHGATAIGEATRQ